MQAALKLKTTVLSGGRIELTAPELPEGTKVELIVLPELPAPKPPDARVQEKPGDYISVLDLVETLPPGPRPFATWEEYERFLQEEKDAWEH